MTLLDNSRFPLGVSFHTLDPAQQPETAALLAGSAVQAVELWEPSFSKTLEHMDVMCSLFDRARVKVRTIHANFGANIDISSQDHAIRSVGLQSFDTALNLALHMGANIIIQHPSSEPITDNHRTERMENAIRSIQAIADMASGVGCRVALELLPRSCLGHSLEELLYLLEKVDPDTVGVCLDTNHLMADFISLPEVVRSLGSRLIALHCSDYDGVDEKHWPPRQGVIDWAAFLQALEDVNYPGPFHYEAKLDGQTPAERLAFLESNYAQLISSRG